MTFEESQSRGPSMQPAAGGRYEAPAPVRSHLEDLGTDELRLRALEMEAELEASAEETDTIDMLELARSEKLLNELEIAEGEKRRADFERFGRSVKMTLQSLTKTMNNIEQELGHICSDLRKNVERTDPGYGAFSMLRQIMTDNETVEVPENMKVHDHDDWGAMITATFTCVTKVSRQVNLLKEQSCSIEKLGDRVLDVDKKCVELEVEHDFKIKTLEEELQAANTSRLRAEQVRMELESSIEEMRRQLEDQVKEVQESKRAQQEIELRLVATEEASRSRAELEQDTEEGLAQARSRALDTIADERSTIEEGLREELKLVNARLAVAMQSLKIAEAKSGGKVPNAAQEASTVEASASERESAAPRDQSLVEETWRALSDMDVCIWTVEQQLSFVTEQEEGTERELRAVQGLMEALTREETPPAITESLVQGLRSMNAVAGSPVAAGHPHSEQLGTVSKQVIDSIQRLWAKSVLARNQIQQWGRWLLDLHGAQGPGGRPGVESGSYYPTPVPTPQWGNAYASSGAGSNLMPLDENAMRGSALAQSGGQPGVMPGVPVGAAGERRSSLSDEASKIVSSFLKKPRPGSRAAKY